jgi:hypothetical protein
MENAEKPGRVLLAAAVVFLAALAVHAPAISGNLLWDDASFLAANPFASNCGSLSAALNPANLVKVLPVPMSARPVVNITLIADACAGSGAAGKKITNLLLHACASALLFLLALTLSGALLPSAAAAALFAMHPAAAEAINVIVFRSHLLGLCFFLAALLASVYYARKPALAAAAAAAGCALLGMLSVETCAVVPAAAAAAVYFDSGRAGLRRLLPALAALLLALSFYAWFWVPRAGYDITGASSPGVRTASFIYPGAILGSALPARRAALPARWRAVYASHRTNLYTMAGVAASYAHDAVNPRRLSPDYAPEVVTTLRRAALPLLFCLAWAGTAGFLLYRRSLAGLGLALAALALLPALNLVPMYNLKADRYLYFPLAGAALLAAGLLRAPGRPALRWTAAAGLMLLFVLVSLRRAPVFHNELSFFAEAVRLAPGSPRAQGNLAAALLRAGDCPAACAHAGAAAGLDAANPALRLRLAYTLAACGRPVQALPEARAALGADPASGDALYLAGLLDLRRDRAAGRALLEKALAADPSLYEARLTLALLDKKIARELSRDDKTAMEALAGFYRSAGLFF